MRNRNGRLRQTFTLSALWIAGIGFFVTRFTVTLAAHEGRMEFLVAGVVPLVLGLLLASFGVVLLVGSFDGSFVRSIARWCIAGTAAMAGLVALTLIGTAPDGAVRSEVVLSNFLIGGGLLGAATGLYAGQNSQNRAELRQQANRLVTINRLLRHEVLNAIAIIRGRAEAIEDEDLAADADSSLEPIIQESDRVVDAVQDVKHLARSSSDGLKRVDLAAAIDTCVESVRKEHPAVDLTVAWDRVDRLDVWADGQLSHALHPLIENAAMYGGSSTAPVTLDVDVGRHVARVRITDNGPGLPAEQRATLEEGAIPDYDDPGTGFGTNLARLFVEGYGGDIDTEVTEDGTTVEVELVVGSEDRPTTSGSRSIQSVGVDRADLLVATVASLVAGGVMGIFVQSVAGVIPVIGALYGVADPLVGWITHEFHSVVFGLIAAGFVSLLPAGHRERLSSQLGVTVGWGFLLWLVAAGLIMPIWLNLVGIAAPLPNVSVPSFVGHVLWGVTLALVYYVGTSRRFQSFATRSFR